MNGPGGSIFASTGGSGTVNIAWVAADGHRANVTGVTGAGNAGIGKAGNGATVAGIALIETASTATTAINFDNIGGVAGAGFGIKARAAPPARLKSRTTVRSASREPTPASTRSPASTPTPRQRPIPTGAIYIYNDANIFVNGGAGTYGIYANNAGTGAITGTNYGDIDPAAAWASP